MRSPRSYSLAPWMARFGCGTCAAVGMIPSKWVVCDIAVIIDIVICCVSCMCCVGWKLTSFGFIVRHWMTPKILWWQSAFPHTWYWLHHLTATPECMTCGMASWPQTALVVCILQCSLQQLVLSILEKMVSWFSFVIPLLPQGISFSLCSC